MLKTISAIATAAALSLGAAQAASVTFAVTATADSDLPVDDSEILAPGAAGTLTLDFDETVDDLDLLGGTVTLSVGGYDLVIGLFAERDGAALEINGNLDDANGGFTGSDGVDYSLFALGGGTVTIDLGTDAPLTGAEFAALLQDLDPTALSGVIFASLETRDQAYGVSFDFAGAAVPLPGALAFGLTGLLGATGVRRLRR